MWLTKENKYARKSLRTRSETTAVERGKAAYLEIYANLQQASKPEANNAAGTAIKPIAPQSHYPINKSVNQRLENTYMCTIFSCLSLCLTSSVTGIVRLGLDASQ